MKKLSPSQIVQLHKMARDGLPTQEISRALQVDRNSVTAHVRGDITYSVDIIRKISLSVQLVERPWLDQREAAPWIPGHPSPAKMHVLMHSRLRSRKMNGRRVTRLEWIADFCRARYPLGIWIRQSTLLSNLSGGDPYALQLMPEPERLDSKIKAYPLCVAHRIATEASATLDLPAWLIHRATRVEQRVGTAVL